MYYTEGTRSFYVRVPARVLGCLCPSEITIILFHGHGLVLTQPIQTHLVPTSLRMPNSEFDVLLQYPGAKFIRILQNDEYCPEINQKNE
jgi:hypothetical protein